MSADPRQLRPFLRVALPVAVAAVFVFLAILNVALVKTWRPEAEDGVLWVTVGKSVVASDVPPESAGARAGIRADDELIQVNGTDIQSVQDLIAICQRSGYEKFSLKARQPEAR